MTETEPCGAYALPRGTAWRGALGVQRWVIIGALIVFTLFLGLGVAISSTRLVVGSAGFLVLFPLCALLQGPSDRRADHRAQQYAPPGVFATYAIVLSHRPAGSSEGRRERVVMAKGAPFAELFIGSLGLTWVPADVWRFAGRLDVPWSAVDQVGIIRRRERGRGLVLRVVLRNGFSITLDTKADERLCAALTAFNAPVPSRELLKTDPSNRSVEKVVQTYVPGNYLTPEQRRHRTTRGRIATSRTERPIWNAQDSQPRDGDGVGFDGPRRLHGALLAWSLIIITLITAFIASVAQLGRGRRPDDDDSELPLQPRIGG